MEDILGTKRGYSVFDNYQVSEKYEQFFKRWVAKDKPPLYFVTMYID